MASWGGKRNNSGRKTKAAKLLEVGFMAEWFTTELQEIKWREFLGSDDERVKLEATKYLTNRIYGMPQQEIKNSGEIEVIKRVIADL